MFEASSLQRAAPVMEPKPVALKPFADVLRCHVERFGHCGEFVVVALGGSEGHLAVIGDEELREHANSVVHVG